jgi:hypothetical protein
MARMKPTSREAKGRSFLRWCCLFGVLAGLSACGDDDGGAPSDADAGDVDGGIVDLPDGMVDPVDMNGPPPMPPVLVSATARQVGRFGDDLRVDLVGSDADGDATTLDVTFLNAANAEIPLFDTDSDGVLDSGNTVVPLDTPIPGTTEGPGSRSFPRLRELHPEIAVVRVVLVDARDARSAAVDAMVVEQPVLAVDAVCDPDFSDNRCADGLGCRAGTPSLCVEGMAPAIVRAAYLNVLGGANVLIEGTDPDDDVSQIDIAFLDATDMPIALDLDGDGAAESTSFGADARDASAGGAFFFRFSASAFFAENVPRVSLVVRDRGDRVSAPVVAELGDPPMRSVGQPCDPRGFDTCGMGVCSPGMVGATNRCVGVTAARAEACMSALVLETTGGMGSVRGELGTPSLWDAPTDCSSGNPRDRPEALVRLQLDAPASRVSLSTFNAYTNFDSTLYVISGCAGTPVVAWCADDRVGEPRPELARLELVDLPAGLYFVVVDSFASAPGRFQLDVTVTP